MLSTTTEFPHISTAVLRFLEWALPQVQEQRRRGVGASASAVGVPWASTPLADGRVQAHQLDPVADVIAIPDGAHATGAQPAGVQRLLSEAGARVGRRRTALAGASLAGAPAGTAGSAAGLQPSSPLPSRGLRLGDGFADSGRGPALAGAPNSARLLQTALAPGAASGLLLAPLGGEPAKRPAVRVVAGPGPPPPTSQAERLMSALAPQFRAGTTPQAPLRAGRLAPALWSTQAAAAQFAAAARRRAGGPPLQAAHRAAGAPPAQTAPPSRMAAQTDMALQTEMASPTRMAPYSQPAVPNWAGPGSFRTAEPLVPDPLTPAPQFPSHPLTADSYLTAAPSAHTTNRLMAEAQLRQMLAEIIQTDALRHGLNLKER